MNWNSRVYLIYFSMIVIGCSFVPNPTFTPTTSSPTVIHTPVPTQFVQLPTTSPKPSETSPGGCARTVIPRESQPPYLLFFPFAPGLEWRTAIDTVYDAGIPTKIYIRAAVSKPEMATVIGTRIGSSPPEQMHATLYPTRLVDPDQPEIDLSGDPPGMIRLLGSLNFPRRGCWDVEIRVQQLSGHVTVRVDGLP